MYTVDVFTEPLKMYGTMCVSWLAC